MKQKHGTPVSQTNGCRKPINHNDYINTVNNKQKKKYFLLYFKKNYQTRNFNLILFELISIYFLLAFHSNYNPAKNIQESWRRNQNRNQSESENQSNFIKFLKKLFDFK